MLGHRKPLCAPSCKPSDLAGKGKFDRVDNATLARAVWSRNSELFATKIQIELPNSPYLFDVGGFQFDHLMSPPAGAENILTKSSDFNFLPPLSNARSWPIFSASKP